LASTGEYTQGGGAVAVLVSANPLLLEIENQFGVATDSVFDFLNQEDQLPKIWCKVCQKLLQIK
jgi:hydroxymethylglutaryl-CoA synthase